MSDLPCIGFGITVVDPGPDTSAAAFSGRAGRPHSPLKRRSRRSTFDRKLRLLRTYVTAHGQRSASDGFTIYWQSGQRVGVVREHEEGTTWSRGHGPQARAALMASRAMR